MNETQNTSKHHRDIEMALYDLANLDHFASGDDEIPGFKLALLEKAYDCECNAIFHALDADEYSTILYNSRNVIEATIAEEKKRLTAPELCK